MHRRALHMAPRLLVALAGFGLAGCPGGFHQQKLQQDVDALKREVRELKAGGGGSPKEAELRTRLADMGATLDQIRTDISLLQGRLESIQNTASKRSDEMLKVRQDLEIRIAQLDEQMRVLQKQMEELKKATPTSGVQPTGASTPLPHFTPPPGAVPPTPHPVPTGLQIKASPVPTATAVAALTDQQVYQKGIEALDGKRYGDARATFVDLITKHPKSDYADNARYWIAESHYAEKDYASAILEFDKVVKDYPNGDKVPAALLKQGFAFLEIGEKEGGVATLQDLMRRYPKTDEAKKAKERLAKLR